MINKIYLRTLRKYKYQLMKDYFLNITLGTREVTPIFTDFIHLQRMNKWDGLLSIKKGYAWDGPSGPTIDTRSFMRGSLIHDALYQLMREGHLPLECREYADLLLRDICLEDGMSKFRVWYVYKAVRMFNKRYSIPGKQVKDQIIEVP